MEIKNIKDYPDYYITSCGKVWSYISKKFLSPHDSGTGYAKVVLTNENGKKDFYIHRLVAEAYIPNPNNYDTVDHIDRIKSHNYTSNLKWVTQYENNSNRGKYSIKRVQCVETGEVYESATEAGRQLNLCSSNISAVCRGTRKRCGGYHFKFI